MFTKPKYYCWCHNIMFWSVFMLILISSVLKLRPYSNFAKTSSLKLLVPNGVLCWLTTTMKTWTECQVRTNLCQLIILKTLSMDNPQNYKPIFNWQRKQITMLIDNENKLRQIINWQHCIPLCDCVLTTTLLDGDFGRPLESHSTKMATEEDNSS